MDYINQYGQNMQIPVTDEKWLDDIFFAEQMAKLPADAPRAGLTYRVSTSAQVDHDDIPMQKIECRKFSALHGWRVVFEKLEKGVSGSKVMAKDRDVIQEIKAEAEAGNFDILLVFMFDRLGRIESETPFVVEWFIKQGIEMWSTREGQQRLDTHDDKLINYIRYWQASGESDKLSARIKTRKRQEISSGHFTGGTVPFGYRAVHKGRVNKKDVPVKDLEIMPEEAVLVREVFERVVNEGASAYALAQSFNERHIRTHGGAKFQASNILRIIRHVGYTGCLATKDVRSGFIPELQIIDEALFGRANKICGQRCTANTESRQVAHKHTNQTLLAGFIYCAHCGARLSGFMHTDRYKLANGTVKEKLQPKYNCFSKGQNVRACDGQQLYKADIIDAVVLEIAREVFTSIKQTPQDKSIEQKIRQEAAGQKAKRVAIEKKISLAAHTLDQYETEVIKCIEGTSSLSREMLSRLIAKSEGELRSAKMELAHLLNDNESEKEAIRRTREYYREFLGWAEEFDLAPVERKRMILCQLFSRVEVGKGYKVTVVLNMSYRQFLQVEKLDGAVA